MISLSDRELEAEEKDKLSRELIWELQKFNQTYGG
jgi:hypothetical protein